jgi:hypothetical protein
MRGGREAGPFRPRGIREGTADEAARAWKPDEAVEARLPAAPGNPMNRGG